MSPKRAQVNPERVGIFGGTFNPIHLGHLRAAEEVRELLALDRVLLVPSAEPPHKSDSSDDPIAPAELRLAWARAAVADNPSLEVDPIETLRGGRSFMVDTLEAVRKRTGTEPVFVIGCDAFGLMDSWREPERLLTLTHVAVLTRPPVSRGALEDWLPDCARQAFTIAPEGDVAHHRDAATWIRSVEISALDISSSDVRRRIRDGRSVRYLLPETMRHAALSSGVYARAPAEDSQSRS